MSSRKCFRCGKDPADGYASIYTMETGTRWYCHGDDDDPTCYEGGVSGIYDLSFPPKKENNRG